MLTTRYLQIKCPLRDFVCNDCGPGATDLEVMRGVARIAVVVMALLSFFVLVQSNPLYVKRSKNGPYKVHFENVLKEGPLRFEFLELTSLGLPPLPSDYAALHNEAFRVSTEAVTSGLHSVLFSVGSVKEEREFRHVRVFQFGNDSVWRDVTVLDFDSAPLFPARVMLARSERLGVYVLAKRVIETEPNKAADLEIAIDGAAKRLTSPRPISYTIRVANRGPDDATDVALWAEESPYSNLISAEPSKGKCRQFFGYIDCRVGSLKVGESITLAVKLEPFEGMHSFPKEGQRITHAAGTSAAERDPRPKNKAAGAVLVLPNPNQGPIVTFISPKNGTRFEGPADITLEATAYDTDGSISKVEFFEFASDTPLGLATTVDGKKFIFTLRGVSPGERTLVAVATDNGGREAWSGYVTVSVVNAGPQ